MQTVNCSPVTQLPKSRFMHEQNSMNKVGRGIPVYHSRCVLVTHENAPCFRTKSSVNHVRDRNVNRSVLKPFRNDFKRGSKQVRSSVLENKQKERLGVKLTSTPRRKVTIEGTQVFNPLDCSVLGDFNQTSGTMEPLMNPETLQRLSSPPLK
jgi:hypothetical protein